MESSHFPLECARAATAGEFHVNDIAEWREESAKRIKAGGDRLSIAMIQTGESVPLLP